MFYISDNFIDRIIYQFDALPSIQAKQLLTLSLPIWHKQKTNDVDYPNDWVIVHEALEENLCFHRARSYLAYRQYIPSMTRHQSKDTVKSLIVHALNEYKNKHNDDSIGKIMGSIKSSIAEESNNLLNADGTLNQSFSKRLFG